MPYGYEEHIDLTPGQILQKVPQERIFELILQQPFSFTARYKSPLREDSNPDCRFESRPDGTILWVDFGDLPTHRTCFRMMMDYTGVSLERVIHILCSTFNLSTDAADYPDSPISFFEDTTNHKQRAEIIYTKREYSKKDILYWSKFIIRPEHLLEDNVFAVSRYYINNPSKEKPVSFSPVGLCYAIDFLDAVKIYQPHSLKYKWISNCNKNHIGNYDNLPATGNTLIITKSYKDHRVFRNIGLDEAYSVVWFQNEGIIPSEDILRVLAWRFSYIVVFFDSDEPGIKAGLELKAKLEKIRGQVGICMTYIPKEYGYKDVGEFIEKEGQRDTLTLLTNLL